MDPATITGALAAGSHVLSLLKAAAEKLKAAGRAEAVGDLIEIQVAMMELLQKQQLLIEENRSLKLENETLAEKLTIKEALV